MWTWTCTCTCTPAQLTAGVVLQERTQQLLEATTLKLSEQAADIEVHAPPASVLTLTLAACMKCATYTDHAHTQVMCVRLCCVRESESGMADSWPRRQPCRSSRASRCSATASDGCWPLCGRAAPRVCPSLLSTPLSSLFPFLSFPAPSAPRPPTLVLASTPPRKLARERSRSISTCACAVRAQQRGLKLGMHACARNGQARQRQ